MQTPDRRAYKRHWARQQRDLFLVTIGMRKFLVKARQGSPFVKITELP